MKKTLSFKHNAHVIRVENTWLGGARLYIDGAIADETKVIVHLERDEPLLSAKLETDGTVDDIVVYIDAISSASIKILVHINGEMVARVD